MRFSGAITALNGTDIGARVSSADGARWTLALALQIDPSSGSAAARSRSTPVQ